MYEFKILTALSRRHCSDCKKCDEVPEREGEFAKKKDDECAALSEVQSNPHDQTERLIFGLSMSEFHV